MQNTGGGGTDDMAMAPHDAGARDSPPRSVVYDAGDVGCPCAVVVWPNGGSGETNKYEVRSLKTVQTKYFVLQTSNLRDHHLSRRLRVLLEERFLLLEILRRRLDAFHVGDA